MANVSSYTFDNMSRLGNDSCCIDQTSIQNVASCNYMTQNYFAADCSMKNVKALATSQPGISPARSRSSWGIVTWPLEVIFIVCIPRFLLRPVRLLHVQTYTDKNSGRARMGGID